MRRLAVLVVPIIAAVMALAGTPAVPQAHAVAAAKRWNTTVFAKVQAPGHPAYVHVHTNGRVYVGTYTSGDRQRSKVYEWSAGGTLLRSWTVPGQKLGIEHGVQVANQTRDGKLVLLETSTRTVRTLDIRTGRFRTVATFPKGTIPNYATWGPRHLFVTDYAKGIIWRVHRKGHVQKWFTSPKLKGLLGFGTTGIVYRAKQHDFLITQQTTADGSALPTRGHLYRLPVRKGRPGKLTSMWTSADTDLPDGIGIGRSGRIYIANAGLTNQLVMLSPKGKELDRFPDLPGLGTNGSKIPFDTPCSATFKGTKILVANQSAIAGTAANMAILAVEVGERGVKPHLPRKAGFAR